jgi:hypothetical protein
MADDHKPGLMRRVLRWCRRVKVKTWQRLVALAVLGVVVWLAFDKSHWPFKDEPQEVATMEDPSFWDYLLADRLTLGFVRLALVAFATFVLLSTVALVLAGRWMKGFSSSGMAADDAESASVALERYERRTEQMASAMASAAGQIDRLTTERDEYQRLAEDARQKRWWQWWG